MVHATGSDGGSVLHTCAAGSSLTGAQATVAENISADKIAGRFRFMVLGLDSGKIFPGDGAPGERHQDQTEHNRC